MRNTIIRLAAAALMLAAYVGSMAYASAAGEAWTTVPPLPIGEPT